MPDHPLFAYLREDEDLRTHVLTEAFVDDRWSVFEETWRAVAGTCAPMSLSGIHGLIDDYASRHEYDVNDEARPAYLELFRLAYEFRHRFAKHGRDTDWGVLFRDLLSLSQPSEPWYRMIDLYWRAMYDGPVPARLGEASEIRWLVDMQAPYQIYPHLLSLGYLPRAAGNGNPFVHCIVNHPEHLRAILPYVPDKPGFARDLLDHALDQQGERSETHVRQLDVIGARIPQRDLLRRARHTMLHYPPHRCSEGLRTDIGHLTRWMCSRLSPRSMEALLQALMAEFPKASRHEVLRMIANDDVPAETS